MNVFKRGTSVKLFMKNLALLTVFILLISNSVKAQNNYMGFLKHEKQSFTYDTQIGKIQYPGDQNIDVTYYKLNLTLTYSPDYLTGIVTVNAKSLSSKMASFFLDLKDNLTVDSVLSGFQKLKFLHSNSKLFITLNQTLVFGQSFSVVIYYQGIPEANGFGSFVFGSHNHIPAIWSLSEPYGASDWWPCKDTPADKADSSDVWITCDTSLTGVSNGILISTINNGNGTHTFKWKNTYPIAQYLISIAVSNYLEYTTYYKYAENDSLPVENYIYPEDFKSNKFNLDKTVEMIKIFTEKYGTYPFIKEKYGQVQFGWSGGMEHQTITSLGSFGESIQSHELSHQWFGDKVTCADWNDIWLNEGFAKYSEAVYFETMYGEQSYKNYVASIMKDAKSAKGSVYVKDISSVNNIFDYDRTYAKGAMVLYMLRGIVGDSTFFRILRTYLNNPKLEYNVATTSDFESVAEEVYGKSLKYFFDEWIYGENFPQYNFKWEFKKNSGNSSTIFAHISQKTNSNPAYFTMPIKLKIINSVKDTSITIFNNSPDQEFQISINGIPRYILFDPDNQIMKEISVIDSVDLTKPERFSLQQNFPNPFNPVTKIDYSIPVQTKGYIPVKLEVYDILGRKVATLVDEKQSAGNYEIEFPQLSQKLNLSSGVYIYTLSAGNFTSSKKMLMLK